MMIIDKFRERWIRKTSHEMNNLSILLSSNEDYKKDFIKVSEALLNTNENPYSFMPKGWESYKHTASHASSFFFALSYAMNDDGEVSLIINKEMDLFKLIFKYPNLSLMNNNKEEYRHLEGKYLDDFIYWLSDAGIKKRRKKMENLYRKNQKWIEENCNI